MRKEAKAAVIAGLVMVSGSAFSQVVSTFDVNSEGWARIEYNTNNTFGATGAVTYNASNGNPGGAVSITDSPSTWFCFNAPVGYLGNLGVYQGGEIAFDILSTTSLPYNDMPFAVSIAGPAGTIYSTHPNLPYNQWQRIRLVIDGERNWRWNAYNGPVATGAQVASVLANVTRFAVMGDYQAGADTSRLDNVFLGPKSAPALNELTFDADAQGVARHTATAQGYTSLSTDPVLASWNNSAGTPGGGLTIGDPDSNLSWHLMPGSLTGDRAPWIGGVFSYDMKNTPLTGSPVSYPFVTVSSGGKTLVYQPEEIADYNSQKAWVKVSVPWETTPGWRVGSPTGPQPTEAEFLAIAGYPEFMRVRAEYWDGDESNTFDNYRFEAPVLTTVSGSVDLGVDFVGDPSTVQVEVTAYRGLFPMETATTFLDANGDYSLTLSTPGDVILAVKPSHWLRAKTTAKTLTGGSTVYDEVAPLNGDVDGDNAVTVFDYGVLSDAFDTVDGDANWDARADLDGDGSVTVFDYGILSNNFDLSGE